MTLPLLQTWLKANDYQALLLPRSDEHLGEYILPHAERVRFLTGFTGSAAFVIVLQEEAVLFTDGRYSLQAVTELAGSGVKPLPITPPPREWLLTKLKKDDVVAYDPKIMSMEEVKRFSEHFNLKPVVNPLNQYWENQPAFPLDKIHPHPQKYAGVSFKEKIAALKADYKKLGAEGVVFSQLDSIAWVLNIRGNDVPNTPLAQSFLAITDVSTTWFVNAQKFTPETQHHIGNEIAVQPLENFEPFLKSLQSKILLNVETTPQFIKNALENTIEGKDLVDLPRAMKNAAELEGMRQAHIRDGVAYAKFLYWFGNAHNKDELNVSDELEACRAAHPYFRGLSFNTIAGAGSNAAIVHYRSSAKTNKELANNSLFLLDSGAQYIDGTTDITRTFAIGDIPLEHKKHYTLVLKGHLALSRMKFPKKVTGQALDAIARQFLWQQGLNFDHGTGHGVGAYLGVHEGSFRISPMALNTFEKGMVLSNEPGFYQDGSHGIRIENLLIVQDFNEKFFQFETLTLVPYDKSAIDKSLLTQEEKAQINAYHKRVYSTLSPTLKGAVRDNLKKLCTKI